MRRFTVDVERVRVRALERTISDEDEVCYYPAALELGASEDEAERIDAYLTERALRAAGAL